MPICVAVQLAVRVRLRGCDARVRVRAAAPTAAVLAAGARRLADCVPSRRDAVAPIGRSTSAQVGAGRRRRRLLTRLGAAARRQRRPHRRLAHVDRAVSEPGRVETWAAQKRMPTQCRGSRWREASARKVAMHRDPKASAQSKTGFGVAEKTEMLTRTLSFVRTSIRNGEITRQLSRRQRNAAGTSQEPKQKKSYRGEYGERREYDCTHTEIKQARE
eukprot:2473788-Pleurochrysis_carterae.AAC.3